MADKMDPPPLFENVDIKKSEDNEEDLFVSAMQVRVAAAVSIRETSVNLLAQP